MACHLADAFRNPLGEGPIASPGHEPTIVGRTLPKWIASYAPVHWPRGRDTPPEADQEPGGCPLAVHFRRFALVTGFGETTHA